MLRRTLVLTACALACVSFLAMPVTARGEEIGAYTGAQLYKRFCASCHGATGEGNGPVAASFKLKVPDLTALARRRGGKYPADQVRRIVDGTDIRAPHGSREMPVWGVEFWLAGGADDAARQQSATLVNRLVEYLGTLQQ